MIAQQPFIVTIVTKGPAFKEDITFFNFINKFRRSLWEGGKALMARPLKKKNGGFLNTSVA